MFTPAYVGRLRILRTLSLNEQKALEGLRPVVFGPCTLRRTWGTHRGSDGALEQLDSDDGQRSGHLSSAEAAHKTGACPWKSPVSRLRSM
jgi:hypothetical protein